MFGLILGEKDNYHPQTKLREGNTLASVCHSVQGRGDRVSLVPGPILVPSPMSFAGGVWYLWSQVLFGDEGGREGRVSLVLCPFWG